MQGQKRRRLNISSLPRSFWYSAAFVAVYLLVLGSWTLLNASPSPSFQAIQYGGITLAALLSFLLSWVGIRRDHWKYGSASSQQPPQHRLQVWVPLMFTMALFFQCAGSILYVYNYAHHLYAFPSWADALILGTYPCLMLGVLGLPARSLSGRVRLRLMLDSLLVIVALMTFSWYFLLGPTVLGGSGGSLLAIVTHLAYPGFDLLLIGCVVLFTVSTPAGPLRLTVSMLSVALAIFVITDSFEQYALLHHVFTLAWEGLGWPLGVFLIALAVQTMRWKPLQASVSTRQASSPGTVPMWRTLLPYALVPPVFGLAFSVWGTDKSSALAVGTYVCSLLLLVLIFLKQILSIREIHWLNRGLQQARHILHEKNEALEQANARLEGLATTDPLTELPNHRALLTCLESEVARAQRYGHPLSVLFFDGDHSKRVNDTYGHSVGDAVLQELASLVRSQLRGGDTVGRYGGEEFLVLLPQTDLAQASQLAERVRKAIAARPLVASVVKEGVPTTISLGVASFPADGTTAGEVVEQADQAMYWAKRLGRNQVRTARDAQRLSRDQALAATISNLERGNSPTDDGLSLEQVMRANQLNTIQSLLWLLALRDQDISTHSKEVSELATAMVRELGATQEEVFAVSTVGLVHDLGKIALPDGLLYKAGPLSPAERTLIQQHPALGAQILEVSPFLHHLMPAVRHHHENWDGTGYPDGLCGEAIPRAARIIRVAEAYQAMTSERPYQRRRTETWACDELVRCAGTHFDPVMVQAALQVLIHKAEEIGAGEHLPSANVRAHSIEPMDPATSEERTVHP